MSLSREEIMDGVAEELQRLTFDPESYLRANPNNVHDVWRCILMTEAFMQGDDPVKAKLAYQRGEIAEVDLNDRMTRLAKASVFAINWTAKRPKSANPSEG